MKTGAAKATLFVIFLRLNSRAGAFSYDYFSDGCFTSIHVRTIDPNQYELITVRAEGKECPRETVRSMAIRFDSTAEVNGGFWKSNGAPARILKIGGRGMEHHSSQEVL